MMTDRFETYFRQDTPVLFSCSFVLFIQKCTLQRVDHQKDMTLLSCYCVDRFSSDGEVSGLKGVPEHWCIVCAKDAQVEIDGIGTWNQNVIVLSRFVIIYDHIYDCLSIGVAAPADNLHHPCNLCGSVLESADQFREHLETHENRIRAVWCIRQVWRGCVLHQSNSLWLIKASCVGWRVAGRCILLDRSNYGPGSQNLVPFLILFDCLAGMFSSSLLFSRIAYRGWVALHSVEATYYQLMRAEEHLLSGRRAEERGCGWRI